MTKAAPTSCLFLYHKHSVWDGKNDNGNIDLDLDAITMVELVKAFGDGNISSTSGLQKSLVNGTYRWTDVSSHKVGDQLLVLMFLE